MKGFIGGMLSKMAADFLFGPEWLKNDSLQIHPGNFLLGLIFYTALLLSLIFTPLSTRLAGYLGILDLPDPRKVHSSPIPRTGGLAMAASLFFSIFMCLKLTPEIKGFLSGAAVVVFLGMLDDKFSLPPKMKFLGEILAVVVFMNVSQISLQS